MSPRVRFWAAFPNNSFRNEPPEAILGCFFFHGIPIETSPRGRLRAAFPRNSYGNEPPGAIPGYVSKEFLQKRAPGGDSGLLFHGILIETNARGRFWRFWPTFPRNSYRNEPPGAILGYFSKEFQKKRAPGGDSGLAILGCFSKEFL